MFTLEVIVGMLFISGIIMGCLGLYARRFTTRVTASAPYVLLMCSAAAWAFLYALELLSPTLDLKVLYHDLRFLFLPFLPVLELWLVSEYVHKSAWLTRGRVLCLLVIPVAAVILAITAPFTALFRYGFAISTAGPVPVLAYTESPFFLIYALYSLALLLAAIGLLVAESKKRKTLFAAQTLILLAALVIPTVINSLFQAGITPVAGINMTPAFLFVPGILYAVALFRYRLLDIIPVARDRLIEALNNPVLVLDPQGHVMDMNPAASSLFSVPGDAALGKTIGTIAPDWPDLLALCKEKSAKRWNLSRTKEGATHYYLGSAEPLLTPHGQREGTLIVLQDVTYLKTTEQALRESEKRYRDLFEINNAVMLIIDPDTGRIVDVNSAAGRYYGYSKEELATLAITDINVSDPESTYLNMALAVTDGGRTFSFRHKKKNGEIRDVEVFSAPVELDGRHLLHSIIQDVTERKHAEDALKESEEKYRTLVESSFDGIAIHQEGTLVYVNQTATRILGAADPGVLIGRRAMDFAAPSFREQVTERMREAPVTSLGLIREQFVKLDGTLIDVDVTAVPSTWEGKPAAYVTFRDITEQARAEDALKESEERYRAIVENLQDVFFRVDKNDTIEMMSPSAMQTFGYPSVEWLIKKPVLSLWMNPAHRTEFLTVLKEKGVVHDWAAEMVKADGTPFWVSISAHLRRDKGGRYQGTEGIIRDITERKKMEDALKTSLNKLNMLSSITRHDILNQVTALRTFLELSREDLKGSPYAEFIEKEDQAAEAIQRQIEFTRYYQDIGVNAPKWQDAAAIIREAATQLNLSGIDLEVNVSGVEIFADPLIVKVFFNLMENSLRHGEGVTRIEFSYRTDGDTLVIGYRDNGVGIAAGDKKKLFSRGFGKHTGLGLFLSREILAITGITISENGEPGKGVLFVLNVPNGSFRFSP